MFPMDATIVANVGRSKLVLGPRPGKFQQAEDDLLYLKQMGINIIICCMEWKEMLTLGLGKYPELCINMGFTFYHCPIPDCTALTQSQISQLAPLVYRYLNMGMDVYIHCRAGLGRSGSLCAACLLHFGYTPEETIQHIRSMRPGAIAFAAQSDSVNCYYKRLTSKKKKKTKWTFLLGKNTKPTISPRHHREARLGSTCVRAC